ncbi:acyl-CoA dehydrogenase family protein [Variovorax sp. J22P168]|uniref:acyl-CoA dehydrogenase family protein n=1 Tax=Variovorax jilinensis TaxID=3053513 RepID=UPI0025776110|nr:acyl-CoA dehydrogenase family protein [Variovorax sp. J22P168]MDM0015336.1 acyl-CoA dehydrogenase family protein [Variovorax sp. J22P168]
MNFEITQEQLLLSESLSRLLGDHYGFEQRRTIAASAEGWSPQVWRQLAELGVLALGIPEAHGGLGGTAVDRLPLLEALGRALTLEPVLASCVLGGTAVHLAGSEAQKDALLPPLAAGELRLAWADEEEEGAPTCAVRDGDGWRLDGRKPLVLHADAAGWLVVSARVAGDVNATQGVALFLVDPAAAGVGLRRFRLVDDTPAAELTLRGVAASALGDPADLAHQHAAIQATLDAGTAAACAGMIGAMDKAFELSTGYVTTRKQFGRLIGEYQALRHRIAEMKVSLEIARSMAMAAAVAADDTGSPASGIELARAKLVIGRHARLLCQAAIQSHGGIGMTEEYAVGHCLRRVHVLDHLCGDVDAQAARLARVGA